ncbi:MAG: alcohol dehydrogenase catalytic domain-containing protein [Microbacteriaceae bacterium]|jgi:L-iditol 2-dehydrogenase|nr:alcohol dehydrogenase catalytic domain-containing protein [Microbacteriaceae bacterium]MBT5616344.1 alcohol dehydrogenase catalytic domain-containing protein [Microbacteriaceae bacterium]
MKAALFQGPGDLHVIDVDSPSAAPDELKIRVESCATCGTDAKIFGHGHPRLNPPQIIGHEIAGEIIEVGKDTSGYSVGDRVQIIAAVPCEECWACKAGKQGICINQTSMGYQYPGGFAEEMIVPAAVLKANGVNIIPGDLSFDEASVTEPLACALNAQRLIHVGDGDTVLVMGAGPIGCLHVRLARALGATKVMLADVNGGRLHLSADVVKPDRAIDMSSEDLAAIVLEETDGIGPSVIITAAPAGVAQEQAIAMAAPGGRVSFFGGLPKDKPLITVDSNVVHYKELILAGANGSSPAQNAEALALIASGKVPVADLITHRLPLSQVEDAIHAVTSGEAIKVVIKPQGV